jgi:glycine cleavage system H protein
MAELPKAYRYTNDHEWLHPEGDAWRIGITQFAANQLGDVVMVELPNEGDLVTKGQEFGTVESVKAVSELFAPVSGRVAAVNKALEGDPELVNTDSYGEGWLIEIQPTDKGELDELMDVGAYDQFIHKQEE